MHNMSSLTHIVVSQAVSFERRREINVNATSRNPCVVVTDWVSETLIIPIMNEFPSLSTL